MPPTEPSDLFVQSVRKAVRDGSANSLSHGEMITKMQDVIALMQAEVDPAPTTEVTIEKAADKPSQPAQA